MAAAAAQSARLPGRPSRPRCRPHHPHSRCLQVIADTAVFGPLHVGGYFTYMTLLEGGSWGDAMTKLRRDFWPTFSAELTVWPPLQVRPRRPSPRHPWGHLLCCLRSAQSPLNARALQRGAGCAVAPP